MKRTLVLFMVVVLCFTGSTVMASVFGKITGMITDAQTKEPLLGVTVSLQGTNLGAVTNEEGVYTILKVPVGTYTLVMTSVGFNPVEISNVQVSADLAAYHDQEMTQAVTDLGQTILVTAERPLVVKDKTTSISIISREELLAMPTRGMEQVVGIQNSVVRMNSGNFTTRQRGQRPGAESSTSQELNLRGGRPSEVAYYVDGFSQQDPLTGISTTSINNNAIKEISVTSGAFSAEYGHVSSGIVNVITNSGSDEYHGNLEILTDNVLPDNFDNNYYLADFGGRIPGVEEGYFFLSGERRFLRDRTPSSMTEEMHTVWGVPFGLDTLYADNPQRLPSNSLDGWSGQCKLDYAFTPNMKFTLSGNGSLDKWREYRQEWALNPDHAPRYEDKNLGINAKVTHTLDANTFYNLSASYFSTTRIRGDGVVFDDYEAYERSYDWGDGEIDDMVNPEYGDFDLFFTPMEEISVVSDPDTTIVGTDTTITNDTVTTDQASYYPAYIHRKSAYIGVKGDVNHQFNQYNTLKMGFDFQRHTLRYFRNLDASQGFQETRVNRYGFDSVGVESDEDGFMNSVKNPINLGMYVQDRFEWRGLIVNAGLRFDYFDYKALKVSDPINPYKEATLGELDIEDMEDTEIFYRLSPRLGIAFPVSDKTQAYINYGIFYQRPDLDKLYVGYDFWEARVTAGSYFAFPNPSLEPEKTTQYEVGLTKQLGDNVALSLGAYYKDVQDLTQIETIIEVDPSIRSYSIFDNIDYGTIKGVDIAFTMRRTRNIRLDLKYTLSYATGTGSYAQSAYVINWSNPSGPPKTTNPLDYDQRHNITGIFDLRLADKQGPKFEEIYPLENVNLNIILYAGSGTPYTPTYPYDEATEKAVRPGPRAPINSANRPWTFNIDLQLEKHLFFGDYEITPYVMVKNVFDRTNVLGVYETTGKADVTGYLETDEGQTAIANSQAEGTDYLERYELKQHNSTNYSYPRMIWFGLRTSF